MTFVLGGTMPAWAAYADRRPVLAALDSLLRGVGQIALMNNPVTGLLIVVALFTSDSYVGVLTIVGLGVSTLTARLLRLDGTRIRAGLFGYNGALVGAALAVFFLPRWDGMTVISVVLCSAMSTIVLVAVSAALGPLKLPPLTLPFNVVAIIFLCSTYSGTRMQRTPAFEEAVVVAATARLDSNVGADSVRNSVTALLNATFRGLAQLFLVDGVVAGILIAIAILVCSPTATAMALAGSALGALVGMALGANRIDVYHGLWSFNSYITGIAIGGLFLVPTLGSLLYGLVAAASAAVAYGALTPMFGRFGAPALTLPFCLTTLVFLLIKDATPLFRAVPPSETTTAEDHWRRSV